jgi:hypothetical protein
LELCPATAGLAAAFSRLLGPCQSARGRLRPSVGDVACLVVWSRYLCWKTLLIGKMAAFACLKTHLLTLQTFLFVSRNPLSIFHKMSFVYNTANWCTEAGGKVRAWSRDCEHPLRQLASTGVCCIQKSVNTLLLAN